MSTGQQKKLECTTIVHLLYVKVDRVNVNLRVISDQRSRAKLRLHYGLA